MKKYIIGVIAILALAFGGWYFASPSLALKGLRDAAIAGDADALEERVDFPQLRESLKLEFKAKMVEELAKEKDNPFAGLGLALADQMVDSMLDGLLTPRGIAKLIKDQNSKNEASGEQEADQPMPDYEIERIGLSKFKVSKPNDPNSAVLIFKRDGIGWKLSEIDLSNVELPNGQASGVE